SVELTQRLIGEVESEVAQGVDEDGGDADVEAADLREHREGATENRAIDADLSDLWITGDAHTSEGESHLRCGRRSTRVDHDVVGVRVALLLRANVAEGVAVDVHPLPETSERGRRDRRYGVGRDLTGERLRDPRVLDRQRRRVELLRDHRAVGDDQDPWVTQARRSARASFRVEGS